MRPLKLLPKAHLHLHFTGSLRLSSLIDLARERDVRLPESLTDDIALKVPADQRGWFRFQRQYDAARAVVKGEETLRRVVREAAEDDAAEGSRRLEIQIEPTSYAAELGGITPVMEVVLDEAAAASRDTGVSVGMIIAASRIRHPLDARTLARLAAKNAGDGPGQVVAFGLSNDERARETMDWTSAFSIARRAGLPGVPHGGELLGPEHVRSVVAHLKPKRLGHGVRATEDPELLARLVDDGIAFEVCPASNISLGVYQSPEEVPLRVLAEARAQVALGADDPLLFHSRLNDQYQIARDLGFDDDALAGFARSSIQASFAPEADKRVWLAEVDDWLRAAPAPAQA